MVAVIKELGVYFNASPVIDTLSLLGEIILLINGETDQGIEWEEGRAGY